MTAMPWVRRLSTVAMIVSTAMLVYAAYVTLALRQIFATIFRCPVTSSRPKVPPGYIEAFGLLLPTWFVLLLWSVIPIICLTVEVHSRIVRWQRDRRGLCLDCGHHLTTWRGKCPGCGVRIGPG